MNDRLLNAARVTGIRLLNCHKKKRICEFLCLFMFLVALNQSCLGQVEVQSTCTGCGSFPTYEGVPVCGECVDFVERFAIAKLGVQSFPYFYCAADLWGLSVTGLDKIANDGTNCPQSGDILIWNKNSCGATECGHMAIVDSATDRQHVTVVESNWCLNDCQCGDRRTISICSGMPGWFRKHPTCTPPSIPPFTGPAPNTWYNSAPQLTFHVNGSDPISFVQCTDSNCGNSVNGHDGYWQLSWAGEGWHHYHITATNSCGQATRDQADGWDVTPPTVSITSGPSAGVWYNTPQRVSWHVSDNASGVRGFGQAWDSNPGFQFSSSDGWLDLQEGEHSLNVHAWDNANNGRGDPGNDKDWTFGPYKLDTVAPSISLNGPATGTWINTPQSISWNVTDATSGVGPVTLSWDGGTPVAVPASGSASIPEGKHSAILAAKDNAGNPASQAGGSWWIDTTPPVVAASADRPPDCNGEWYSAPVTVTLTASDPNGTNGSGVAQEFFNVDGRGEAPYGGAFQLSSDGVHTVAIRAVDAAGNSSAVTTQTIRIDTTPPTVGNVSASASTDLFAASWTGQDATSGVCDYTYWVGSQPGGQDIIPPTSTGGVAHFWRNNLSLTDGQIYYLTIQAADCACNQVTLPVDVQAHAGITDRSQTMAAGGVSTMDEARRSTNYALLDTFGEPIVGDTGGSGYSEVWAGYWSPDTGILTPQSLGQARKGSNPSTVDLATGLTVTAGTEDFANVFYVEDPDRSSGIRVEVNPAAPVSVARNMSVSIVGRIDIDGGERVIKYPQVTDNGSATPIKPVYLPNWAVGGSAVSTDQPGVYHGQGLLNVGLLVQTAGFVYPVSDTVFYVDDGSGVWDDPSFPPGVRVSLDGLAAGNQFAAPMAAYAVVTGISSVDLVDGNYVRCIRPRDASGIRVVF